MARAKKQTVKVENEVTVVSLTQKENKVLEALVSLLYAEAGFSDIEVADLAKSTKMKLAEVKGVVGSLVKKELIFTADAFEQVGGAKGVDLIYLSPMAWSLHPDWNKEAEFDLKIEISDAPVKNTAKKPSTKSTTAKKPASKPKQESIESVKSLEETTVVEDGKNKPYSVFGMHGHNKDLDGFKKGDKIAFDIKGRGEVIGEYTHFHINNWSKNGYVVIKFEGKIYERVAAKVRPVVAEKKKRVSKKQS